MFGLVHAHQYRIGPFHLYQRAQSWSRIIDSALGYHHAGPCHAIDLPRGWVVMFVNQREICACGKSPRNHAGKHLR